MQNLTQYIHWQS